MSRAGRERTALHAPNRSPVLHRIDRLPTRAGRRAAIDAIADARATGRENLPPADAKEPTWIELEMVRRFERLHRECAEPARSRVQELTAQFTELEASLPGERDLARCVAAAAGDVDRAVGSAGELAALWAERERKLRDLRVFAREHGIARDARYPGSRWLHLGLLAVLLLVESWANARFFAEATDFGLLGGFVGACGIALVNVGSAFITGWLGLPWLAYRNGIVRLLSLAGLLGALAFAGTFNLLVAGYRDHLTAGTASSVSLRELLHDPFGLSFVSAALLATGLLAWALALWKGYTFDDGYPFYGAIDRRYRDADRSFLASRDELVTRVVARVQHLPDDLHSVLDQGRTTLSRLDGVVVEASQVRDGYETDRGDLQVRCATALRAWREVNCLVRTDPPPLYFAEYPLFPTLVPEEAVRTLAERADRARALHADLEARAGGICLENAERVATALARVQAHVAEAMQRTRGSAGE